MAKKLGFIGTGNMATAIINGAINAGVVAAWEIIASDTEAEQLAQISKSCNVETTPSNIDVAKNSEIIFLSIKPHIYQTVIDEIKSCIKPNAMVIILAAGLGLKHAKEMFGEGCKIKLIKTMPNTPARVNCGMTAVCAGEGVTKKDLDKVLKIFNSVGKTEILPEYLFDAFTAISGSSPAYAFMFIEAMADAGVKHGLSRRQAIDISAQALLGAAKMVLETGENPATLKGEVCSPGGTTIAAVCELEKQGFRNAIISAVTVCAKKYKILGDSAPEPKETFEKV
ncbi:MAG: pyrroline-5-carboxylate reductase [Defluviitaleaceae bacterium]|nr:pyrroline-5-carboxylate reductase [Defluviitaleaceae bacterium]